MAQKLIRIGVEMDRETDTDFDSWADTEGRSKRRHASIVLRRLTGLFKTHRGELERLGLASKAAPEVSPSR